MKEEHKTRRLLIDTTSRLMERNTLSEITSEKVLEHSGISKGSMYHFFIDFNQLLEETQIERFNFWADELVTLIEKEFSTVKNITAFKKALRNIMLNEGCAKAKVTAIETFRTLASASSSDRFYKSLRDVQNKIYTALEKEIEKAIEHIPNLNKKFTPEKLALLVELWICGRNIGNYHKNPINQSQWGELTDSILNCIFS
jgi:AcrR family transcriptional regulator